EMLVAGAELEASALGRHAPAVQIGQQTEERYRQRDVRTRDALRRAVAGGDRAQFAIEPFDVVIRGVEAVRRRRGQLGEARAPRSAPGEPLRGVAAAAVEIVKRGSKIGEIRTAELRQDAARDQRMDL